MTKYYLSSTEETKTYYISETYNFQHALHWVTLVALNVPQDVPTYTRQDPNCFFSTHLKCCTQFGQT